MIIPSELIKKKRDGAELSQTEIQWLIESFTNGQLPDYQMSAFLMAVFFKGMTGAESHALTQAMLHSGTVLNLNSVPGFKVDKHSTGGIGDKTSLILAPIVASLGIPVPMIAGRGLGHTGGTLDKLESIPGFSVQLSIDQFQEQLKNSRLALIGQTKEICPADKKLYALRDVTATVESLPLICGSIMSKKLAEGIDGLVLDVKYGSGAFMKTVAKAELLARALIDIGVRGGKRVTALITNMNKPLGRYVGNSLEIEECLHILKQTPQSRNFQDCETLSLELAAQMVLMAEKNSTIEDARKRCRDALVSGAAHEAFEKLCQNQGGRLHELPKPKKQRDIIAKEDGVLAQFDNEKIGYAAIALRAGRLSASDPIDPTAGLYFHCKPGEKITKGQPIVTLFADTDLYFREAQERIEPLLHASAAPVVEESLIAMTIRG